MGARGYVWIHPSLIEVEFKIYVVADVVINRWTDGDFLAAVCGEGAVLIQATVAAHVVPYPEIEAEIDYPVSYYLIWGIEITVNPFPEDFSCKRVNVFLS